MKTISDQDREPLQPYILECIQDVLGTLGVDVKDININAGAAVLRRGMKCVWNNKGERIVMLAIDETSIEAFKTDGLDPDYKQDYYGKRIPLQ